MRKPIRLSKITFVITDVTDEKLTNLESENCHSIVINKEQPPVFLPHQNLAKSHHLSSGTKYSKPL